MKPLKVKVSITLDEDLVLKIRELAEEDDRSFSQYINMALENHQSPSSVCSFHTFIVTEPDISVIDAVV